MPTETSLWHMAFGEHWQSKLWNNSVSLFPMCFLPHSMETQPPNFTDNIQWQENLLLISQWLLCHIRSSRCQTLSSVQCVCSHGEPKATRRLQHTQLLLALFRQTLDAGPGYVSRACRTPPQHLTTIWSCAHVSILFPAFISSYIHNSSGIYLPSISKN